MSEAKEILSLIICILAVYTASALFAAGVYFILRRQWKNKAIDNMQTVKAISGTSPLPCDS